MIGLGALLLRMQRIAMTAERADRQAAPGDRLPERLELLLACQQCVRLAVRVARIRARPNLDGLDAELDDVVEHLLERLRAEQNGEYTKFHIVDLRRTDARWLGRAVFAPPSCRPDNNGLSGSQASEVGRRKHRASGRARAAIAQGRCPVFRSGGVKRTSE